MKKETSKVLIGSIIGTAALMVSASVALADSTAHLDQHIESHSNIELHTVGTNTTGHIDVSENDNGALGGVHIDLGTDGKNSIHVVGTPSAQDEVKVWGKNGTSTRDSADNDSDNSRGNHATSTATHVDHGKGGVSGFFSWIFGLPASTTIGDLRAQMTATTSANTSHSEGLGFWTRIFEVFHFGGNKVD